MPSGRRLKRTDYLNLKPVGSDTRVIQHRINVGATDLFDITRNAQGIYCINSTIRRVHGLHTWLKCILSWKRNANNYLVCRTRRFKADGYLSRAYQAILVKETRFVISQHVTWCPWCASFTCNLEDTLHFDQRKTILVADYASRLTQMAPRMSSMSTLRNSSQQTTITNRPSFTCGATVPKNFCGLGRI